LAVWFAAQLIACSQAIAAEPPLSIAAELLPDGEWIGLELRVQNSGQSTLMNLVPVLRTGSQETELLARSHLAVGRTAQWSHRFRRAALRSPEGITLPVLLTLQYDDATLYPLSVPLVIELDDERREDLPLRGRLEAHPAAAASRIALTLENSGAARVEAEVRLFLAGELAADPSERGFSLAAGESATTSHRIHPSGALPGATYPVYAVVQYAASQGRGVLVLSTSVRMPDILAGRGTSEHQVVWIAALIVLLFGLTGAREMARARSSE
jgi:hypothetical protein